MLPAPSSFDRHRRSPSIRRLFSRARPVKSTLLAVLVLPAVFLLLIFLFVDAPTKLLSVPFRRPLVPVEIEAPLNYTHDTPQPKYYDDEPHPPNWKYRADAVKNAFLHAYRAYEANAFPADELFPLSNKPRHNFNSWGVSVVDAMDTMFLMDLKDEFKRAVLHVSNMTFEIPPDRYVHFFETTIRYLGGLLSAHALTGNPVLLEKADELGHMLLPVFNTSSGLPTYAVNPQTGQCNGGPAPPRMLLAEIASFQLEFRYLAHATGRTEYYWAVDRVNGVLQVSQNRRNDSLWPSFWETEHGAHVNDHISIGAWADSAYEYVLKQYLQTSRTEQRFKRMHMRLVRGVLEHLLYLSPTRNLLYVTDVSNGYPTHKLEHLSCFYPGLLALGARLLKNDSDTQMHRWAAEGLAHTCWTLYGESVSGLAPEEAQFPGGAPYGRADQRRWMPRVRAWDAAGRLGEKPPGVGNLSGLVKDGPKDYSTRLPSYLLRPETIETLYLMWKTTGEDKWRERGWFIFKAIEKHCRLYAGYGSIRDVDNEDPLGSENKLDDMPSYALAETWKYLYLMFLDTDPVPLDKWVFNTEAHPLPVFEWNETEKRLYKLT